MQQKHTKGRGCGCLAQIGLAKRIVYTGTLPRPPQPAASPGPHLGGLPRAGRPGPRLLGQPHGRLQAAGAANPYSTTIVRSPNP